MIAFFCFQLAKLLHYAGKQRLAEVTFAVFAISFFIARLVIFPFWLVSPPKPHNVRYTMIVCIIAC